jgi:hypothetical protein
MQLAMGERFFFLGKRLGTFERKTETNTKRAVGRSASGGCLLSVSLTLMAVSATQCGISDYGSIITLSDS